MKWLVKNYVAVQLMTSRAFVDIFTPLSLSHDNGASREMTGRSPEQEITHPLSAPHDLHEVNSQRMTNRQNHRFLLQGLPIGSMRV